MQLKAKLLGLDAGRPVVILHPKTAQALDVHVDERLQIERNCRSASSRSAKKSESHEKVIAVIDIASRFLKQDEIVVSNEIAQVLSLKKGEFVCVSHAHHPESIYLIHKKLDCQTLSKQEIKRIVSDIVNNALTEAEIAYFVSAVYARGMSMQETAWLTESIVETGQKLGLGKKIIADKHGIGGIAGNRTTPIVVSICAAAGLTMPKTSSRAITSAAGTADVIETIADVDFSIPKLKEIVKKTGACLAWGGSLNLAPADDKIIQVERLLKLDPEPQLLASIMSKKLAAGSTHVLIDLPYGSSAKVTRQQAKMLRKKFLQLAKYFKIKMDCVLTDGSQPVGNGIGPVLEMQDVIAVLKQLHERPLDLEKKSLFLSARLLELTGRAGKHEGMRLAAQALESGKAFKKFQDIIKAQNGHLNNLKPAALYYNITAGRKCRIAGIDNKKINAMARRAGCPADKKAGLYLHAHAGAVLGKGEKILTIYAESRDKLKEALDFYKNTEPIKLKLQNSTSF